MRLTLIAAALFLLGGTTWAAQDEYVRVDIQGIIHADSNRTPAIEANGQWFRLDLGGDRRLSRDAQFFTGQLATVSGFLYMDRNNDRNSLVIDTRRIEPVGGQPSSYNREWRDNDYRSSPPREEVIIKEKKQPLFKIPGLEINKP